MSELLQTQNFFDVSHSLAGKELKKTKYPWEALPQIGAWVRAIGETLPAADYERRGADVWVARTAKVYETAVILGPTVIGPGTEVRPGAFLRGNIPVGERCMVGNSTELKNVILFDNVQVPHYNYAGDSILGFRAHMGAGSITSNVKSDKSLVTVRVGIERAETGLKKFGAVLGDGVEVGCNTVLNPGCMVGRGTRIYPLSSVRGYVPERSIYKSPEEIIYQR